MPRKSRESEIVEAIRSSLAELRNGPDPITDEKLMAAASCSRRTFYKYVRNGSAVELEIERARREQEKVGGKAESKPDNNIVAVVRRLRAEAENAKRGAKELAAVQVRFVSNLIDMGVPASVIDQAQRAAMSKPDRSVSRAGYPRGKRSRRR